MKLLGMEIRGWTLPEPLIAPWNRRSTAGILVDRGSALGIAAVWACVRLLASTVSRMPVDTLIDQDGHSEPYPAPRWLRKPLLDNPNFGRVEHFSQVMMSLLFEGNFFTLTVRDNSHDVSEIINLDPTMVEITGTMAAPGYKVRANGRIAEYGPDEILHRPLLMLPGTQRGVSPIEAARQVIGVGLAGQEYAASFFSQSGTPPGYIAVPQGATTDAARLKKEWMDEHSGPEHWHEPGVLTGGAKWETIAISNDQAQFLEQRQFSVAEICRLYGVPPHMVGDVERSTSWGTGIEQQGIGFVTYSLNDYLVLIEEAYRALIPNPNSYLRFNRNALLRGDAGNRGLFYQRMFAVGAMSPNDIREKEDLAPVPVGKSYFVPSNFKSTEQALKPPAPPSLPVPAGVQE